MEEFERKVLIRFSHICRVLKNWADQVDPQAIHSATRGGFKMSRHSNIRRLSQAALSRAEFTRLAAGALLLPLVGKPGKKRTPEKIQLHVKQEARQASEMCLKGIAREIYYPANQLRQVPLCEMGELA